MYIVSNAFRNIIRNRGRNTLIGAILLVIIIASVVALMINNTTGGIIDDYKSRFGTEVSLVVDMQKLREQAMANMTGGKVMITRPVIPADQYIAFGDSAYLKGSEYSASVGVNSDGITAVDAELGGGGGRMMMAVGDGAGADVGKGPTQFMMQLLGAQFEDFTTGDRELAEGRMPQGENEAMISEELAKLNHIAVGDTIILNAELRDAEREAHDILYTLTVVGIYYDITDEYGSNAMRNAFTNRRNEILTNYQTVVAPMQEGWNGININATYYLKSPETVNDFAEEVYAKGLDPIYNVTTDEASYNRIVGPVEGLKSISITFMIMVMIFGGMIIALMSSIAVRERKYEIGVLRAMGMKKFKVAFGLWSEMLLLTCLCVVIGIAAGTLVAQPVTNVLLDRQIEAAEQPATTANGFMMMGTGPGMGNPFAPQSDAQPLSELHIAISLETMLQVVGIALLLATLAGLVSVIRITKYEPMKILMERN